MAQFLPLKISKSEDLRREVGAGENFGLTDRFCKYRNAVISDR